MQKILRKKNQFHNLRRPKDRIKRTFMDIIVSNFMILVGIALFSAVILYFVSQKFIVKENDIVNINDKFLYKRGYIYITKYFFRKLIY